MTRFPWPPSKAWEIHIVSGRWPRSTGTVFLAEAARRIGNAMFVEWCDASLGWLYRGPLPFIPEAERVFTEEGVNQPLYELYHGAVRQIVSVGFFEHMQLLQAPMEDWLASMVPDPNGGEPITLPQLRYQTGADREDPITGAHWKSAWWQAAMNQDEIEGAERYIPPVATAILKAAQSGALKTYARPFHGGVAVALEPRAWEIDDVMARLAWCALDPDQPYDPEAEPTHWIFLDEVDLTTLIRGIAQTSLLEELQPSRAGSSSTTTADEGASNVVHLPSKAAAVTACTSWLVDRFDDPTTERMVKGQFKEEALQRFLGRIGVRGFEAAWTNAREQRPERAKPGRRPQS